MRILVKLGTRLLTKPEGGLDSVRIDRLAGEVVSLLEEGHEFLIVSSGAVEAGRQGLGICPGTMDIRHKQAAASIGQTDLMNAWRQGFASRGRMAGQILVSSSDFALRSSYLNIRNTLNTLLERGVIPVINENDTVAVEELKFGDNDRIAAIVTVKVDADKLILLTDVEGLRSSSGELVKEVNEITPEVESWACGKGSECSSGGMGSKIQAARMVSRLCGIDTYVAQGSAEGVISEIIKGSNPGTVFHGGKSVLPHRKRWIAGMTPAGSLTLDAGAVRAVLEKNSSVLAVGITGVGGDFTEGDPVSCLGPGGEAVALGLANFSAEDIRKIAGCNSSSIKDMTGGCLNEEVINRDNLVIV